jgi:hypothetical protein
MPNAAGSYFSETAIVTMSPTSNTENNAAIGAGD